MLAVTDRAIDAIRQLEAGRDVPEGAGLRIASDPSDGSVTLTLTASPAPGDEIIDWSQALVFLEPEAAVILTDQRMDAASDADGRVRFTFARQ